MVVVILSGLRPCQALFTKVKGLGGETGRGQLSFPERESVQRCAVLEGKQQGGRPFSWCDSLAKLLSTFLDPSWPVCL